MVSLPSMSWTGTRELPYLQLQLPCETQELMRGRIIAAVMRCQARIDCAYLTLSY